MNIRNVQSVMKEMNAITQKTKLVKTPNKLGTELSEILSSPKKLDVDFPIPRKKSIFSSFAATVLSPLNKIIKKGKAKEVPKLDVDLKTLNSKELHFHKEEIKIGKESYEQFLKAIEELKKSKDVLA